MNYECLIMNFRNYILITIILAIFVSCSPQQRLNRLITKHPELSRVDTIKIQDTVIVPGPKVDTVFSSSLLKDTVTITKDKLQIKLIEINDTIYLDAEVEPDTVILTKEILVDRIVHTEPAKWWVRYWWVFVLLVGVIILLVLFRR